MAERMPTFERQVAVQDAPGFRPILPEVVDIGPRLGRLSDAVLREAEPRLKAEAEERAIEDAGLLTLAKDPDGNYMAPVLPEGAGLYYKQAFEQAAGLRYVDAVTSDYEIEAERLSDKHSLDPDAFLREASAVADGRLAGVDPRNRGEIEAKFRRETIQRYNALSNLKTSRDYQATTNGLMSSIQTGEKRIKDLLNNPDPRDLPAAQKQASLILDDIKQRVTALRDMGVLSNVGADATMQDVMVELAEPLRYFRSQENYIQFAPTLNGLGRAELMLVNDWASGTPTEGKVGDMDYGTFTQAFPSLRVRADIGQKTGGMVSELDRQADAAARAAEAARTANAMADMAKAVREQNHKPAQGLSKDEVDAVHIEIGKHGTVHDQMSTYPGRQNLLGLIAQHGYVIDDVVKYIDGRVLANNIGDVVDFVDKLALVQKDGMWIGREGLDRLDGKAKAAIAYYNALTRAGIPPTTAQDMTHRQREGGLPTLQDFMTLYPAGTPGKPRPQYSDLRAKALADAMKADVSVVKLAKGATDDFDKLLPYNMQMYPTDPGKALQVTAQMVSSTWQTSTRGTQLFVGGVAHRDIVGFLSSGPTMGELTTAVQKYLPAGMKPAGASFQSGSYRLEAIDDSSTKGFGVYSVTQFSKDGRPLGTYYVDMDVVAKDLSGMVKARRASTPQQGERPAVRPHFTVQTVPGKVEYERNANGDIKIDAKGMPVVKKTAPVRAFRENKN